MVKSGEATILKIDNLATLRNLQIETNQNKVVYFYSAHDMLEPIALQITQSHNSSLRMVCVFNHSCELNVDLKIIGDNTISEIYNLVDLANDKKVTLNQNISTSFSHNKVIHVTKCVLDQNSLASVTHLAKAKCTTKNLKLNQKIQSLLLSPKARVKMQPILQIESGDVQCKHGSTQGFLDVNAIFYLQSRGLDLEVSKQILVEIFKSEILELMSLS
jgi:SUF system FeS cluster assembly, SufBD